VNGLEKKLYVLDVWLRQGIVSCVVMGEGRGVIDPFHPPPLCVGVIYLGVISIVMDGCAKKKQHHGFVTFISVEKYRLTISYGLST
jgi:hypothetical protein